MKVCYLSIITAKNMLQFFAFTFSQHQWWCTEATDSSMFSSAPMTAMLLMSDV